MFYSRKHTQTHKCTHSIKQNYVIYFMWKMSFVCFNAFQLIFQSFCLSFNLFQLLSCAVWFPLFVFCECCRLFLWNQITKRKKNDKKQNDCNMFSLCAAFFHFNFFIRKSDWLTVCTAKKSLNILWDVVPFVLFVVRCYTHFERSWNCSTWLERLILICNSWCNCFIDAAHVCVCVCV